MFESFMWGQLLADSVDTTLSIIVVQQIRCSVKCTISERAENGVRSDALSLCGS